jgi:molybdate transport system ATP-binding protein
MSLSATITKALSSRFSLGVDITVPPGVTILFGASGSGKSTILRCLAGLVRPDAGRISLGDRRVFDALAGVNVPVQDRRVGCVFQRLALFPHLSVAENIAYGLDRLSRNEREMRVGAIAASFRIADLLGRRPGDISGGEQQRVALARALVTEPSALLLDEPLSGLDYSIHSRIMDDLRRLNEARRLPILYVTHAHREVYALGDRVIAIDNGRVAATGSPHDVLEHPAHEVLAHLAGFENIFSAIVLERRDAAGTMHVRLADGTEIEVPLTRTPVGGEIRVAIRAGDILLANQPPQGISARNVLRGTLDNIRLEGATMIATVLVGCSFVVHLTPGGLESLGIRQGSPVWLIVKTYSCRVALP